MLIRKSLIAFLLFGFVTVHGQLDQNSLRNAKNYINSKVSAFVIEVKALSDKSNVKNYEPIKPKLETVTIEKPLTYDELYKLLLPHFNRTLINFSGEYNKVDEKSLIDKTPENGAIQLIESAYSILKEKYPTEIGELSSKRDNLTKTVTGYFKQNVNVVETKDTSETTQAEVSPNSSGEEVLQNKMDKFQQKNGFFDGFNGWILIAYVLLLIVFIYLFRLVMSAINRVEKRKREIENLRESIDFSGVKSVSTGFSASDIERKIKGSDKIAELENEIRALKDKLSQMNIGSAIANTNQNSMQSRIVESASANNDVFYMSSPNNNYFPNTAKSNSKENTVYMFQLTPSRNEAYFEVHTSGATAVEIAKRRESYIKPACDEENMPTLSTKAIITKQRGFAKLEGDKWNIITKAIVRYE
jgi:hypothetical protein